MAYQIEFTDTARNQSITVEDNTLNIQTSLAFPGKGYEGYGTYIAENFLHLLENFSSNVAPRRPVEGQLWYDISGEYPQVKVFNGTSWVPAGGLNKGNEQPDDDNSSAGDLWVDTENQQLYIRTQDQDNWILVGPDFAGGLATGAFPKQIVGTDNVTYSVTQIDVNNSPIAIISDQTFNPKSTINGFPSIKAGVNIPNQSIVDNQLPKYNGLAETAESLTVNNEQVDAANFLRGDTASISQFPLNIRNNNGIVIGSDSAINLGVEGQAGLLEHRIEGSNIDIRVKNNGVSKTVLRIDSSERLGINNQSPEQALDVTGNIQTDSSLFVNGTQTSTSIDTGSVVVNGGIGVKENLNVGGSTKLKSLITDGDILPTGTRQHNLGSDEQEWDLVYARRFVGDLSGEVSGNVSGLAGRAERLQNETTFSITGDLESNSFLFDGATGGTTKTFNVTLKNTVVGNRDSVSRTFSTDQILLNRIEGDFPGLYKISTQQFLNSVPTNPPGVVMPYVGDEAPSGWALCDGSEYRQTDYPQLFRVIGRKFGSNTRDGFFRVPDLRGRFPLGADNMGNTSADVVTANYADFIGAEGGTESVTVEVENLPDHRHDLRSETQQYYAVNNNAEPDDPEADFVPSGTNFGGGQRLDNSGGVVQPTDGIGNPIDIMNPSLTMNYIIYLGESN
jgi:microcystin-dependent protein/cytoskeletal protein CcmA (bactofilin family)